MSQLPTERRKLLFLLPFAPQTDAAHGGGQVMAHLLLGLAERHDVAVIYLRGHDEPAIDLRLKERCALVQEVHRPAVADSGWALWLFRLRLVLSLLKGRPIWCHIWSVPAFQRHVRSIVLRWQPDLVQVEYHVMGQYLHALNGFRTPVVLRQHEPGTSRARELAHNSDGFLKALYVADFIAWRRFERSIYKAVQAVVVFTERDRTAVQELSNATPAIKIAPEVRLPPEPLNPLGHGPPSLLFVGDFAHPPNVDAAMHLVRHIFPAVQACIRNAHLYIVGKQPPEPLWQAANEQVTVTGFVPDVVPYLDRAAVVVAPLRIGGGMRVKVLEALAAGKAVVASTLAAEGLNVTNGKELIIADDVQEFSKSVVRLLVSSKLRASLAEAARSWACASFERPESVTAYDALYERLLAAER